MGEGHGKQGLHGLEGCAGRDFWVACYADLVFGQGSRAGTVRGCAGLLVSWKHLGAETRLAWCEVEENSLEQARRSACG